MRTQFALGFLTATLLSFLFSALLYETAIANTPNLWTWLIGIPTLGYWIGQRPRSAFWRGAVCGWIAPNLILVLPELPGLSNALASRGGCGNGRRWLWGQATGLLFCLPAALGQLRSTLRKSDPSRLPQ